VLTKATLGLPEMWNASSMAVCYPNPLYKNVTNGTAATVVELIDPTVAQASAKTMPVNASFPDEYGFVLGSSGTTFLRKGKYYFAGLPPSISDRFYVTVESGPAKMNLIGKYVEKESGGSYLELNVLTASERAAIKSICVLDPVQNATQYNAWNDAADALATEELKPSPRTNYDEPVKSTGEKEITLVFPDVDYYFEWRDKVTNDTSLIEKRFIVEAFTATDLGTPMMVVCGQPTNTVAKVAFAKWNETTYESHDVGPTRRNAAKAKYEELGLNKYLGK